MQRAGELTEHCIRLDTELLGGDRDLPAVLGHTLSHSRNSPHMNSHPLASSRLKPTWRASRTVSFRPWPLCAPSVSADKFHALYTRPGPLRAPLGH
eukprot:364989-Chlamydomonas_euryale.AAC.6